MVRRQQQMSHMLTERAKSEATGKPHHQEPVYRR